MTKALKRFDNRLKRFRALIVALNVILFVLITQTQQAATRDYTQSTATTKPTQASQNGVGRRV